MLRPISAYVKGQVPFYRIIKRLEQSATHLKTKSDDSLVG
jgi:hypothetical protein